MTHDPFQTYPMLGAYSGAATPFGLPFGAPQSPQFNYAAAINPLAAPLGMSAHVPTAGISQLGQTGYPGMHNYGGIHPQQLQIASALAQQAVQALIPQLLGLSPATANWQNQQPWGVPQNPLQNPLVAASLQNPLILAALQNQQPGPQPYGQIPSPYGQAGSPAPQSWVGQGNPYGGNQPFGQVHPLLSQQLAGRVFPSPGISPWTGF
jgi:hypothetical protein